jgi:predicted  nucleic acid-binding Zn-ribbon protein
MDIIKKIKDIEGTFGQLNERIKKEQEEFEEIKKEKQQTVNNIVDEQKRLQGERRILVAMGEEHGILEVDEKGNITPIEQSEE